MANTFILPRGVSTIPQSRIDYNAALTSLLTSFASVGAPSNIDLEGTPGVQTGMLWYKAGSNTQDGQGQFFVYDGSNFTHNGLATYKIDNMANANAAIAGGKVSYGQLVVLGDDTTNRLYIVNRSNTALFDTGIPPSGYVSASANLLNGFSSAQFVRSDVATTVGAEITSIPMMKFTNTTVASKTVGAAWFSGTSGAIIMDNLGHKRIAWNEGAGSLVMRSGSYYSTGERTITTGDGAATIVFTSDATSGKFDFKVAAPGTADSLVSYAQVLTLDVNGAYLNSNALWHSGNMGTGSNLDSDTVDSLHATQFLRSDVDTIFTGTTLTFNDSNRAAFGTNNDLLIFHNGASSFIRHEPLSVGNLNIENRVANTSLIFTANSYAGVTRTMMTMSGNTQEVVLYASGVARANTTANGFNVTGNVRATGNVVALQTVFAGNYVGNASAVFSLNAANLFGIVDSAQGVVATSTLNSFVKYTGNVTTAGAFYTNTTDPTNTPRLNYGGYFYATRLYGDGSNITNLDATALTGTISADRGVRLGVPGENVQSFVMHTGNVSSSGCFYAGAVIPTSVNRLNYQGYFYATRFYGDGSNITSVNAISINGIASSQIIRTDAPATRTSGTVRSNDGVSSTWGSQDDLQIYHLASNVTTITKAATSNGDFQIQNLVTSGYIYVNTSNSAGTAKNALRIGGGLPSVTLYHDGVEKFQTAAGGVNITGAIAVSDGITAANYLYSPIVSGDQFFSGANEIFGLRAWALIDSGTNVLLSAKNIASITRPASHLLVCYFTTPMPDTNYCVQVTMGSTGDYNPGGYNPVQPAGIVMVYTMTTTSFTLVCYDNNTDGYLKFADRLHVSVVI